MVQTWSVKHLDPKQVEFALYSPDEIRAVSVVKVSAPVSFNALGYPMKNGLYDPAMGPMTDKGGDLCATCQQRFLICPGHLGHIELPLPVVNPLFIKTVAVLLRTVCLSCYRLQVPAAARALASAQMRLLDAGRVAEAHELAERVSPAADALGTFVPNTVSTNSASDADAAVLFAKEKLDQYVQEVLSSLGTEGDAGEQQPSKHVEAARAHCTAAALQCLRISRTCVCRQPMSRVSLVSGRLVVTHQRIDTQLGRLKKAEPVFMTPEEARTHLRQMWLAGAADFMLMLAPVLQQVKDSRLPPDVFFLEVVPVPPPRARPLVVIGAKKSEHPQTISLQEVVQNCVVVRAAVQAMSPTGTLSEQARVHLELVGGKSPTEKLHTAWQSLQSCIDRLVDSEAGGRRQQGHQEGLKQIISKKEGLVRMHMMGKRVNFAARSVITPDPNLAVDEIGVPEAFARTLTFPTPVTPWNVEALRRAVLAGPDVYPGAVAIRMENEKILRITKGNSAEAQAAREGLAKRLLTPEEQEGRTLLSQKVVLRHLRNGDMLLLNRQPTLHRPSIMAHKVRVLRGERTLRMHYANCKAYNADFDGDEMNAHFPQNEVARAEAALLADVPNQYLVPKDGSPLGGLIQDHVIAGVRLAARDTFLTRGEYCELLVAALPALGGQPRLLPPAMLRPRHLWTGKQVLSSVLLNVLPPGVAPPTLLSKAKISSQAWQDGKVANGHMSEAKVVIRDGELLCGVLDKQHLGSTTFGLTHVLYELYGGATASRLLSALGRLFTAVLQRNGFTLGVQDILVVARADTKRRQLLRTAHLIGPGAVATAAGKDETKKRELLERVAAGDLRARAILDAAYKSVLDRSTDAVSRACIPDGLVAPFPANNLQLMVQSGAKGSTVNTLQISCLLGQIELEGRRPPLMPSGKALPSFRAGETEPRAGGFIAGRFLTGIRPQEFFFHCMAGREGLIDTAVKTSRSGYLQRCLVKHLEGLVVGYDGTVRDSDGSVVQMRYGEDGLDVTRSQFLIAQQLPVLAENCAAFADAREMSTLQEGARALAKELGLPKMQDKVRRWQEKHSRESRHRRSGKWRTVPEPAATHAPPAATPATPPEHLAALIEACVATQPEAQRSRLRDALWLRVARAHAHAGEPVGVLAAQSIGEPSTQMTLNTFHFAGRGEMNVTLGIPRLRELLMMASRNIKTPSAEVPVRGKGPRARLSAEGLRRQLRRTCLSDLLAFARVRERLDGRTRRRLYTLHLMLLPAHVTRREHAAGPRAALAHVGRRYVPQLLTLFKKRVKARQQMLTVAAAGARGEGDEEESPGARQGERGEEARMGEGDSSDDEPAADDEDATAARQRARRAEEIEYEEPEEEEAPQPQAEEDEEGEDHEESTSEAATGMNMVKVKVELAGEGEQEEEGQEEEEEEEAMEDGDRGAEWEGSDDDFDEEVEEKEQARREQELKSRCSLVSSYRCGGSALEGRWCEITLAFPLSLPRVDLSAIVRDAAQASIVRETPGIKRAFLTKSSSEDELLLKTDGVNLSALQLHADVLAVDRLYANDVAAVAHVYGIEAARAVLVKEVRNVFRAYGIGVDVRHLALIADYMTFSGAYEPLNRRGLESATSPFQQMAFESTLAFVQSAALRGRKEPLQSPSARLMVGRPCVAGTGIFALRQKLLLCS